MHFFVSCCLLSGSSDDGTQDFQTEEWDDLSNWTTYYNTYGSSILLITHSGATNQIYCASIGTIFLFTNYYRMTIYLLHAFCFDFNGSRILCRNHRSGNSFLCGRQRWWNSSSSFIHGDMTWTNKRTNKRTEWKKCHKNYFVDREQRSVFKIQWQRRKKCFFFSRYTHILYFMRAHSEQQTLSASRTRRLFKLSSLAFEWAQRLVLAARA